jgi:Polysaccharide deacetylase
MADQPTGDPYEEADRRAELRARRRAQELRRLRRQRRIVAAIGALGLGAIVVVGAGAILGGGDVPDPNRDVPGLVRNATPQPDWRPHTGPVPILEYHVLGAAPEGARYPELFVGRGDFRRQMDWLQRHGFEAITLDLVQDAWYRGGTLPRKPVVISFDDGYRPQFTFALPTLRKHGWAGVLNLKAEGSDLYRSNVAAMIAAGWELASHTIDHSDLTMLDAAGLKRELVGSRRILRDEYGVPVRNFCYPAGQFDAEVIAAVEAAGYEGATTEIPAYARRGQPYRLARYEILGSDGVAGMAARLRGGRG